MILLLFFCGLWLFWVWLGYPLTLCGLQYRATRRNPTAQAPSHSAAECPQISILICAYNEAESLPATLSHLLAQDYPLERIEVLVCSDASEDGTDDEVRAFARRHRQLRLRCIRQPQRAGKTAGLNHLAEEAVGDLLVFCDANSCYAPHTISALEAEFRDPGVGYVTGRCDPGYSEAAGSAVGRGLNAYRRYEYWVRRLESQTGLVVGCEGGIDAVRRSLYRPMAAHDQPDFVLPLRVAGDGYQVRFAVQAIAYEAPNDDAEDEYAMRRRVALRALWALFDLRALLNPLQHPRLAWRLASHKLLRYLQFIPLAILVLCALVLTLSATGLEALTGKVILLGAGVAVGLALGVSWLPERFKRSRLATFCSYFLIFNRASLMASIDLIRGRRQAVWRPRKG